MTGGSLLHTNKYNRFSKKGHNKILQKHLFINKPLIPSIVAYIRKYPLSSKTEEKTRVIMVTKTYFVLPNVSKFQAYYGQFENKMT